MPAERPRRADARRNHDAVLAAARKLFAERGVDVPLDDVARHAGVGNATMYRHFPTRQDLIIAVYADEVTELCESGDALLAAGSPGDALHEWLGAFVAHVAGKRDLALALPRDGSALFGEWHEKMLATALGAAHQGAGRGRGPRRPDRPRADDPRQRDSADRLGPVRAAARPAQVRDGRQALTRP